MRSALFAVKEELLSADWLPCAIDKFPIPVVFMRLSAALVLIHITCGEINVFRDLDVSLMEDVYCDGYADVCIYCADSV